MKKYLEILGIGFGLSKEEIKKVHHKKAIQYHPDRNSNKDKAERIMMEVNGAYDYIIENFNDYIEKIEVSKSTAIGLYNEGLVIFYNQQEYKLALSKFQKSIELDKNYYNSYIMIAKCMQELGDTDGAIKMYDKVIDMNNSFNLAYQNKAELLYTLGRKRESNTTLEEYYKIKNVNKEYYNDLVEKLFNEGDYKSILIICDNLENNKSKLTDYHWYKYKSLLLLGNNEEAYEYRINNFFKIPLNKENDNDNFESYEEYNNDLVENLFNEGDYKSILIICDNLENNKSKLTDYHWYKYKSLLLLGNNEEAYEYRINNFFKIPLNKENDNDNFESYIIGKGNDFLKKEMYYDALNAFSILRHLEKYLFKYYIGTLKAYIGLKSYTIANNVSKEACELINSKSYKEIDKKTKLEFDEIIAICNYRYRKSIIKYM